MINNAWGRKMAVRFMMEEGTPGIIGDAFTPEYVAKMLSYAGKILADTYGTDKFTEYKATDEAVIDITKTLNAIEKLD
jgi:hypothetical protein